MKLTFIVHLVIGLIIRLALYFALPPLFLPSRVELSPPIYSLLDQPTPSLLTTIFSIVPTSLIPIITLILSLLPALILDQISHTSAIVHIYSPYSILTSLSSSSYVLVFLLQTLLLLLPKHRHLLSPVIPILCAIYPAAFPIILVFHSFISPTCLFTIPIFIFFSFPTSMFVSDLSPNLGLYWNLFTNMFPEYKLLYTIFLPLIPTFVTIFIYFKMQKYTFYYYYVVLALIAISNPYMSLYDLVFLVNLFNVIWGNLNIFFWKFKVIPYVFSLFPLLFAFFLDGFKYATYNSNNAYGMGLCIGFCLFSLCEEIVHGCLQSEYLVKHKILDKPINNVIL
ncbi:GPI transamidase component PIG-U [Entamoeba marina]